MTDTPQDAGHPFARLTPDFVLNAIDALDLGFICDGRLLALNSYENRVYQVGVEDGQPLIAKFYRPNRWSDAQIQEEHDFCFALVEQELPVVAPMTRDGVSLFYCADDAGGFRVALFPRKGGHAPELDNIDNLMILGRLLGRLHRVGASAPFTQRPGITLQEFGVDSAAFVLEHFVPEELKASYRAISDDILARLQDIFSIDDSRYIRVHGDCHIGNMLWRDDNPHFVDLDDSRMAPAIQDIWMLLSGDRAQQTTQLSFVLEGYRDFNDFDSSELLLVEALRTLRMMNYSAWLARRWDDPAFPHSFPWFNSQRYWEEHILQLREQRAALDEAPLVVY